MEPRLTPSHNLEEESLFGTWTTFRRWSGILSKSLQERESHAPLRIHSGYSLAFFFLFFLSSRGAAHESSMLNSREQIGANLAAWKHVGWAARCICYTACTQIFLWGNWVWSQLAKADLGCGTNLYMWDHWKGDRIRREDGKDCGVAGKISQKTKGAVCPFLWTLCALSVKNALGEKWTAHLPGSQNFRWKVTAI